MRGELKILDINNKLTLILHSENKKEELLLQLFFKQKGTIEITSSGCGQIHLKNTIKVRKVRK